MQLFLVPTSAPLDSARAALEVFPLQMTLLGSCPDRVGTKPLLGPVSAAHRGHMTSTQHLTGSQLKEAVIAELAWMPSVGSELLDVCINDGGVTLSGQVQTYPEKHAAVQAALRVRGVTAVVDEIEVHSLQALRPDIDIAEEAADLFRRTPLTPPGSVKVHVCERVVTLTGSVAWHYQREAVGKAIAALPGVHGVHNLILCTRGDRASPRAATTKIVAALTRNANLNAADIRVDVADNKITLTGHVASWAERVQASHTAWAAPGVTHVDNELRVIA
jgi:osmotically-inducible protein OsmY